MRKESKNYLKKLLKQSSPSGFEQAAQRVVEEYLGPFVDSISGDYLGNRIAKLDCNKQNAPKIMIAAHCDEIGLMTTSIEDDGQVRITQIGGADPAVLVGQFVIIHAESGDYAGVIGRKAIHMMKEEEQGKVDKNALWIDCGFMDKKDAQKRIGAGDPVSFVSNFQELSGQNIASKGCDDKAGVFVMSEVMRLLSQQKVRVKNEVYGVSTTREETELQGAITTSSNIKPDVAIAIDVTHCTDFPEGDKSAVGEIRLGNGPVVGKGSGISPLLFKKLISIAEKKKIPYQREAVPNETGTDLDAMQVSGNGAASALVMIPCRYMHSPTEIVNLKDIEHAIQLISEFVKSITPDTQLIPD
ncbi:MAG: M42 family metallopeptidase [Proteobacteria bacterium]|nr:M42 family metallopeptidase [Pseudomonadota bacterium]